jgi:hypothetical protein
MFYFSHGWTWMHTDFLPQRRGGRGGGKGRQNAESLRPLRLCGEISSSLLRDAGGLVSFDWMKHRQ